MKNLQIEYFLLKRKYRVFSNKTLAMADQSEGKPVGFKILLRDICKPMVEAWKDPKAFGSEQFADSVLVGHCCAVFEENYF